VPKVDAALRQVVRRHLDGDAVAGEDAYAAQAHLARGVRHHCTAVVERHAKYRVAQPLTMPTNSDRLLRTVSALAGPSGAAARGDEVLRVNFLGPGPGIGRSIDQEITGRPETTRLTAAADVTREYEALAAFLARDLGRQ
jgi:hypothetical protein